MTCDPKLLAELLFDSGIRIGGIWPIHALTYALPAPFTEAVDWLGLPEPIAGLIPNYSEDDALDGEEFAEAMGDAFNKGLFGYIIMAEHPHYTAISPTATTSSWSYSEAKMLYAPTVEDGLLAAVDWDREDFEVALAKYEQQAAEQGGG